MDIDWLGKLFHWHPFMVYELVITRSCNIEWCTLEWVQMRIDFVRGGNVYLIRDCRVRKMYIPIDLYYITRCLSWIAVQHKYTESIWSSQFTYVGNTLKKHLKGMSTGKSWNSYFTSKGKNCSCLVVNYFPLTRERTMLDIYALIHED